MNSAIYNGSFLFVFVLSIIFLGERVTLGKLMGCLLCLGGLVLIAISSLSQMSSNHGSILGYAALLFSMCTWAVFSVTAEKYSTPLREVCEGVFFVAFSSSLFRLTSSTISSPQELWSDSVFGVVLSWFHWAWNLFFGLDVFVGEPLDGT